MGSGNGRIGEKLQIQMEAVEDERVRKRFAHFVNAPDEKDPTIKFETLRQQVKAADWK